MTKQSNSPSYLESKFKACECFEDWLTFFLDHHAHGVYGSKARKALIDGYQVEPRVLIAVLVEELAAIKRMQDGLPEDRNRFDAYCWRLIGQHSVVEPALVRGGSNANI